MLKTKTLKTLGGATLAALSLGTVFAFASNNPNTTNNITTNSSGRQNRIQKEFTNLTDAQKAVMEQAKTLFDAGKSDEAKTLLTNAGIQMPQGHRGMGADMKKVHEAIATGDYATFKTIAASTPLANLSETTFNSLVSPMKAKIDAEKQIDSILSSAGISLGQREASNNQ